MDKFWLYDPMVLIKQDRIKEILPQSHYSLQRRLNAMTRMIMLLTVLGYLLTRSIKLVISSVISLVIIVILYKNEYEKELNDNLNQQAQLEGFDNKNPELINIIKQNFTNPTKQNPLMNVLVSDISDQPDRPPAAPSYNDNISDEINKTSKSDCQESKLFKNLGDNLTHQHMMRNFYSMPNTEVCNNQKGFREFCYGSMKSCKEGSVDQCSKNLRKLGTNFY